MIRYLVSGTTLAALMAGTAFAQQPAPTMAPRPAAQTDWPAWQMIDPIWQASPQDRPSLAHFGPQPCATSAVVAQASAIRASGLQLMALPPP